MEVHKENSESDKCRARWTMKATEVYHELEGDQGGASRKACIGGGGCEVHKLKPT